VGAPRREQLYTRFILSSDQSDASGSAVTVEMIPRSFWDEDPRFVETYSDTSREYLRRSFDASSFCPTKEYVCLMTMHTLQVSRVTLYTFNIKLLCGVKIAGALTTATEAEDLADAFPWIEGAWSPPAAAQDLLQRIRDRACSLHGTITSHGSVPVPSSALNSEVAYIIFSVLQLEFDVHLTGLRSATHLNGRHGVIRGQDHERWRATSAGGPVSTTARWSVLRR
jgi:hypothetical protein